MKKKVIKGLVLSTLSLVLFGGTNCVSNNANFSNNVFAKSSTKVIQIKKNKTAKYHAIKGALYSSAKLNKVVHYAKNYKHTTFYSTRYARVKTNGGNIEMVNYVKNSKGSVKGWINHHNLKKVSKTTTGKFPPEFNSWNGFNTVNDIKPDKHGVRPLPHTNIKIKTRMHTAYKKIAIAPVYYATMTNGHTAFLHDYVYTNKYALERMPGVISHETATNLSNSSGHWRLYYINGIDDTGLFKGIAPNISGYQNLLDAEDKYSGMRSFPTTFGDIHDSNDAAYLVSYSKKVLLLSKQAQKISDIYWGKH